MAERLTSPMVNKKINTILLVEDEPLDVQNIKNAFSRNGMPYHLVVAENGHQALQMLLGQGLPKLIPTPHIILLDIRMPIMDGINFLTRLRAIPELKACNVYVLTNSDEEKHKIDSYNLNVAGYILKPAAFQDFVTTIGSLIEYWKLIEIPPTT